VSVRGRIGKLEREMGPTPPETASERKERRVATREAAEHMNNCRVGDGKPPTFEITEAGDVLAARDGKPIESFHATLAEEWYWDFLEWEKPAA